MGLFNSRKTSLDYLKEISKESKRRTRAAERAAEAEEERNEAIVQAERERTRASILLNAQAERNELSKQIVGLEFDSEDPKSIVKNLSILCGHIDGWLSSGNSERRFRTLCKTAESKLKIGIAQLSFSDPSNPMLAYFNNKTDEYQDKRKKIKKYEIIKFSIPVGLIVLSLLAMCIYGFASLWDDETIIFLYPIMIFFIIEVVMLSSRVPLDSDEKENN